MTITKQICYWLLVLILATQSILAQPTFSNQYSVEMDFISLLEKSKDGGYYFAGYEAYDVVIGKIDSLGNAAWTKIIGQESTRDFPVGITELENGNLVLGFYSDYGGFTNYGIKTNFICFNSNGDVIYQKNFVAESDTVTSNYILSSLIKDDYGFTAVIKTDSYHNSIIKVDSLGNIIKSINIELGSGSVIFKTSSNKYLISNAFSFIITTLNSNFQFVSAIEHSFNDTPSSTNFLELNNGDIITYGNGSFNSAYFHKFNAQMQFISSQFLPSLTNLSGHQINNNSILFFGMPLEDPLQNNPPFLLRVDLSGLVQEFKKIPIYAQALNHLPVKTCYHHNVFAFTHNSVKTELSQRNPFFVNAINPLQIELCDMYDDTMPTFPLQIELQGIYSHFLNNYITNDILIDDTLNIVDLPISWSTCDDTLFASKMNINKASDLNVFPNPNNGEFNIRFSDDMMSSNSSLEIYNSIGNLVYAAQIDSQQKQIKTNLETSIYFMKLKVKGEVFYKKIIIQ